MKLKEWEKVIKAACERNGTYEPFFDLAIEQLAGIMEIRDDAVEEFKRQGGSPIVEHTNKGGYTSIVKNPALAVINECNQQALAYWRDLGLTPAGFKRLSGKEVSDKKQDGVAEMLARLGA